MPKKLEISFTVDKTTDKDKELIAKKKSRIGMAQRIFEAIENIPANELTKKKVSLGKANESQARNLSQSLNQLFTENKISVKSVARVNDSGESVLLFKSIADSSESE